MARKEIKGPINDQTLNNTNHNFIELYDEYIKAGLNAADARKKATRAAADSTIAKDTAETTREEMLAIIREQTQNGDLAPEIAQARGGEATLGERFNSVDSRLAQKADEFDLNVLNVDFGEIDLPSDFPHTLPFKIFAVDENTIEHDFDINSYKAGAGVVYLDSTAPPSQDGLTPETATKHFYLALQIAESLPQETVVIYIMNKYYSRNFVGTLGTEFLLTKNIVLSPYQRERSFIGSFEEPALLSWTADGKAYKTTRSASRLVLDLAVPFKETEPTAYKQVSSVAEVQAEEGTFCIIGSDVWVRRHGDKAPDDDLMVMLDISNVSFKINDQKLIFDRISWFWFYDSTPTDGLKVTGNANSELVLYKSSFAHAYLNGLASINIGKVFNVESKAYGNRKDGFNYHGNGGVNPYEFVYEYYAEAFDNGGDGADNNNASSAHDGLSILRIGTLNYRCEGPVVADVNGCYSILINCVSHSSTRNVSSRLKTSYVFTNSQADKPGKVILINCGGGGKDTFSLSTDGEIELLVKRFKGRNISPEVLNTIRFM